MAQATPFPQAPAVDAPLALALSAVPLVPRSPLHSLFQALMRLSVVGRSLYLPAVAIIVELFAAIPGLLLASSLFLGSLPTDLNFRLMAPLPLALWSGIFLFLIYFYASRRIRIFMDTLVSGDPPSPRRAEAAWAEALALPSRIVGQMLIVTVIVVGAGSLFISQGRGYTVSLVYLLASFVGVATILTVAYFLLEWAMLPVIEQCYQYGARGDLRQANITRTSQQRKLMGLITVTLLVTLALLVTLIFSQAQAANIVGEQRLALLRSISGIGLLSLPLGLLLSWLLVSNIGGSISSLSMAMEQVAAGALDVTAPVVSTDEVGLLANRFNQMVAGLREREMLRDAFGRYVSPEVAEAALADGTRLGGTTLEATVLFADIRNFTGMSESLRPDEVIGLLNSYYSTMVDVVHAHGGLVNKFVGDGMLVIFGAPLPRDDHPRAAAEAAQAMRHALRGFNERQRALGRPELAIGIGIATGEVVAGNVGSAARLEYTVLGDTVNLASRIQDLCKELKHDILLSHTTRTNLPPSFRAGAGESVAIRGRHEREQVFKLE